MRNLFLQFAITFNLPWFEVICTEPDRRDGKVLNQIKLEMTYTDCLYFQRTKYYVMTCFLGKEVKVKR